MPKAIKVISLVAEACTGEFEELETHEIRKIATINGHFLLCPWDGDDIHCTTVLLLADRVYYVRR